ncbi:hypothetical protein ACSGEN_27685 [Klebsiella pneumoniae]|uniref:hypothetical protein n=1 Tax=Klebsiella pneumoniae TaxID=573 RepID=UPI00292B4D1B|nr:hypothetical protein [Klebsiella pneumoniae]MDV1150854.1 hypothetical protein [Klebsiella pneumoniae]MDV1198198.1 hypothetical protein [Klebsiella pneumoniae]MDV1238732.1 hypothetical protein [Klebsiella pneumoniae]MDV1264713.1 hypothetical protein [Klebsiella pneumoniae]MDV1921040.1 hypothetical protein [Klebsiella pneumoniae]
MSVKPVAIHSTVMTIWSANAIYKLCLISICVSWLLSVVYLFLALTSISDPNKHMHGAKPSGLFYGKGIFKIETENFGFKIKVTSNLTVDEVVSNLPDQNGILKELTYEKMKITYIREIKLGYYSRSTKLMSFWLLLSTAIYLINNFIKI